MNSTPEIDDTWVGVEGENEGTVFLLRWRPNLQNFIQTNIYTNHLQILWDYISNEESLLPTITDLDLMEKVENALVDALEKDVQAILAFVYTGQNQREWHWYVSDIDETGKRLNQVLSDFEKLPLTLTVEEDPNWDEYKSVVENGEDLEE